jgi:DNA modification methylase
MKTLPLTAIKIAANRQRRDFDPLKLNELADSIRERGLYHAIVVRLDLNGEHTLVSGERRLRAVTDISDLGGEFTYDGAPVPSGHIPYTTLGDLSALEAEEAELEENIRRVDLSWQDRAAAVARLSALRSAQAADRGEPAPSVASIALEVRGSSEGVNQENTRREIIVARHLGNPEVKAAKSIDEAWKVLKRAESLAKDRALGEAVGKTFTAEMHRCFNADSLTWLAACPAEQFDVILTDPPYGMGADEFGDSGGLAAGGHGYVDDEASFTRILDVCQTELFRVAKPQAHLYWFCDIDQFHGARLAFIAAGWWVFRTPLIWHKPSAMRAPWPEHGPQRKYETILYAVKGKRPALRMAPDLITYQPDSNLGHSAQKPVALFTDLLTRSVRPGDTVLDPFCGTGPVFAAAHGLKCRATGVEIDAGSYGIAVRRIEGLKAQGELLL